MYSIDKVQRGVARYLEIELLPKLEGKDKWILTGIASLALNKMPELVKRYSQKDIVKLAGIMTADAIDIDAIANAIKPAARQTPATFQIPFGGKISLAEADIDILLNEIKKA